MNHFQASYQPPAPTVSFDHTDRPDPDDPGRELQNWSSLIGIVTAIVGNILIALALNVQRYAHIKLHQQRVRQRQLRQRAKAVERHSRNGNGQVGYGTVETNGSNGASEHENAREDADDARESDPLTQSFQSQESMSSECSGDESSSPSTYLKSPYWWMGQILITVGELGNFLAYGFAPASIVSPLGVVALISNCIIAPILFHETFRKRDFWGVVVAVCGAVTVVLSAKQEEVKLEPHDVLDAITTIEFEVYLAVTLSMIVFLMWASTKYGNRTILIDLGLVGLFGGYTVLATKGVSSMLSSTLLGAFATPVTYALIFILLATAVMQVRYVNKALQRFNSTQVIPIQFVMFTLSVIVGSAVLYRDFERTTLQQAVKFIGGCLLTFFGVFLITSGREGADDEDGLSDVEGVEETIGLAEQDPTQPVPQSATSASVSRRSSRASRVSFAEPLGRPITMRHDSGIPSLRIPTVPAPKPSPDSESAPLLTNPWSNSAEAVDLPPGVRTISDESVPTIASGFNTDTSGAVPDAPLPPIYPAERPVTPRPPTSGARPHSHHFAGTMISPSPLSSTVSAVVKDTLLRNAESPLLRKSSRRRLRSSIRASLFMPESEDEEDEEAFRPVEATQSHEQVAAPFRDTPIEGQESLQKNHARRPRSLSDTLGELFKVKRKKKASATDGDERV